MFGQSMTVRLTEIHAFQTLYFSMVTLVTKHMASSGFCGGCYRPYVDHKEAIFQTYAQTWYLMRSLNAHLGVHTC